MSRKNDSDQIHRENQTKAHYNIKRHRIGKIIDDLIKHGVTNLQALFTIFTDTLGITDMLDILSIFSGSPASSRVRRWVNWSSSSTKSSSSKTEGWSCNEIYEMCCQKTYLPGFRPGPTQTGLYSNRT